MQNLATAAASPWGQAGGKVALLQSCKKFPRLQSLVSGSRRKIKQRREIPPPLPGSLTHRPSRRGPVPWVLSALQPLSRGRRSGSLPRAASVCHSPAARGVVTPPSVSAARGGAGKWLPACELRSSSPSSASASSRGAAVSGGGVARVRAVRWAGATERRGGGSRAPLGAAPADALREVGVPRRGCCAGCGRVGPPLSGMHFWSSGLQVSGRVMERNTSP